MLASFFRLCVSFFVVFVTKDQIVIMSPPFDSACACMCALLFSMFFFLPSFHSLMIVLYFHCFVCALFLTSAQQEPTRLKVSFFCTIRLQRHTERDVKLELLVICLKSHFCVQGRSLVTDPSQCCVCVCVHAISTMISCAHICSTRPSEDFCRTEGYK